MHPNPSQRCACTYRHSGGEIGSMRLPEQLSVMASSLLTAHVTPAEGAPAPDPTRPFIRPRSQPAVVRSAIRPNPCKACVLKGNHLQLLSCSPALDSGRSEASDVGPSAGPKLPPTRAEIREQRTAMFLAGFQQHCRTRCARPACSTCAGTRGKIERPKPTRSIWSARAETLSGSTAGVGDPVSRVNQTFFRERH